MLPAPSVTLNIASDHPEQLAAFLRTVLDLSAEKSRLEDAGVTFIREPEREFWGGLIATFLDPDGNYPRVFESRTHNARASYSH